SNWNAGRFFRTAFNERLICFSSFFGGSKVAAGFVIGVVTGDSAGAFGSAVAGFGFSVGGLKAIGASAGVNGKGVGTGGPLEGGTLSDADAPVPFGETSIKGIFLGAGGSLFGLSSGE